MVTKSHTRMVLSSLPLNIWSLCESGWNFKAVMIPECPRWVRKIDFVGTSKAVSEISFFYIVYFYCFICRTASNESSCRFKRKTKDGSVMSLNKLQNILKLLTFHALMHAPVSKSQYRSWRLMLAVTNFFESGLRAKAENVSPSYKYLQFSFWKRFRNH